MGWAAGPVRQSGAGWHFKSKNNYLLLRNAITREFLVICCLGTGFKSSLPTKQYNFHLNVYNYIVDKSRSVTETRISIILDFACFLIYFDHIFHKDKKLL